MPVSQIKKVLTYLPFFLATDHFPFAFSPLVAARNVRKHITSPFDGFQDRADDYDNGNEQSGFDNHLCLLQWEGSYRFWQETRPAKATY